MAAGASIVLYSEYTVTENEEKDYTNTVELIGALADDNNFLDTTKEYKATADFHTVLYEEPPVITGVNISNIVIFIGVALLGLAGGSMVVLNRKK